MDWTEDLEFGHPVIDRQHREIAALTVTLRELLRENQAPSLLVPALTEYCRLISDHFALERGLMEQLPQKKYAGHVGAHAGRHSEMVAFVQRAIEDLSAGQDSASVAAGFPVVFDKLLHNIVFDDAELSRLLIAEKILLSDHG